MDYEYYDINDNRKIILLNSVNFNPREISLSIEIPSTIKLLNPFHVIDESKIPNEHLLYQYNTLTYERELQWSHDAIEMIPEKYKKYKHYYGIYHIRCKTSIELANVIEKISNMYKDYQCQIILIVYGYSEIHSLGNIQIYEERPFIITKKFLNPRYEKHIYQFVLAWYISCNLLPIEIVSIIIEYIKIYN